MITPLAKLIKSIESNKLYEFFKTYSFSEKILHRFIEVRPETQIFIIGMQKISVEFIEQYMPIDFYILSMNPYLIELLKEGKVKEEWLLKLDWEYIVSMNELSFHFLEKYYDITKDFRHTILNNSYMSKHVLETWENKFIDRCFHNELHH